MVSARNGVFCYLEFCWRRFEQMFSNVFADLDYPFVGAADHGYSEALYLEDLEGNGIELYRDKPVAEWDPREDGRIVGVTGRVISSRNLRLYGTEG